MLWGGESPALSGSLPRGRFGQHQSSSRSLYHRFFNPAGEAPFCHFWSILQNDPFRRRPPHVPSPFQSPMTSIRPLRYNPPSPHLAYATPLAPLAKYWRPAISQPTIPVDAQSGNRGVVRRLSLQGWECGSGCGDRLIFESRMRAIGWWFHETSRCKNEEKQLHDVDHGNMTGLEQL